MIFAADIFILNRGYNGEFVVNIIKIIAVFRGDGKLCGGKFIIKTSIYIFGIFLGVINACVEDMELAVMLNRTSRKAAAAVVFLCGIKCDILMIPVYKVGAYGMSPVHSSPLWRIGKILIKQVIFTLVVNKSVGVIYPAF